MIKKISCIFLYCLVSTFCIADQQYDSAVQRLLAWKQLIHDDKSQVTRKLLNDVNDFFNRLQYIPETDLQGPADNWLTPYEFLEAGGGDCEDFAIAKYFTLVVLGVPESQLRITYVTIREGNLPHMVLTYYSSPDADPLVLDNVLKTILPATQRPDLIPVYSFNGEEVWLNKNGGKAEPYSNASSLSKWQALKRRLKQQGGVK